MPQAMTTPAPVASTEAPEFQALLNAAVDGIVVIDHQGRIQAFNPAAQRLFGYSDREVLGGNVSLLMAQPQRGPHDRSLERYVAERVPHILGRGREVEARRKDGSLFPVFLSVGELAGPAPRFVGFVQDLSPRQLAEQDTHRLQQQLAQVARLATVGEMSAGIAHELNQPLTAVANYAQACDRLLALPEPDIAEIRGALQQITAQAVRAGDIIRRLRALARNDLMRREPTDINLLVVELGEIIRRDAEAHAVRYRIETAAALPAVDVDRSRMQQVILNLVRNALDALEETAGGARELRIRTRALPEGEVEIAVCDNGPGVAPTVAPRLFEPFCTSKAQATGLGLAISRTIVRAHKGALEYHANIPSGACFVVRLPVAGQD